jgi:hypothetical protein
VQPAAAISLPGPQALAWLVLQADDVALHADDRALWERLQQHEGLAWLQSMVARFATMVRHRQVDALDGWLAECTAGPAPELRNFAVSLEKDGGAVRSYSYGPMVPPKGTSISSS